MSNTPRQPIDLNSCTSARGPHDFDTPAGGTAIRIKGEHLLGVTEVEFIPVGQTHGVPGTILRIVDDYSMSVVSPPGVGKVNIRLTNSAHTSSDRGPQCGGETGIPRRNNESDLPPRRRGAEKKHHKASFSASLRLCGQLTP